MAGEEYESPVTGLTYTVPKYEEPADAPLAFKDFADSITVGGPATREDAVLQALAGDGGLTWQEGMALSVVEELPDDSVGEIGDVVFVTGAGDGSGGGGVSLDSPVFTGVPEAPTAAVGTNTDQIATTSFVQKNRGALELVADVRFGASTIVPVNDVFSQKYDVYVIDTMLIGSVSNTKLRMRMRDGSSDHTAGEWA